MPCMPVKTASVSVRMKFVCFLCRTAWVQKIKAASELYIETEKKKREKAYLGNKLNHYTHMTTAQPWPAAKYRVKTHVYRNCTGTG